MPSNSNDDWTNTKKGGTVWQVPNTLPVNIPGVLELPGGPWGVSTLRIRGTTAKGNGTTKEVAALYRLGKLQRVGGKADEYRTLADRLNGWEVARYFVPGKPEDWRSQMFLPPEPAQPCPWCGSPKD